MDSLLSYTFIVGTTYEYHFQNDTDATISQLNCTGGEEVIDIGNETMYYRYDCFKKDEELGYLTLSPVFIPGIMFLLYWLKVCGKHQIGFTCIFVLLQPRYYA